METIAFEIKNWIAFEYMRIKEVGVCILHFTKTDSLLETLIIKWK